MDIRRLPDELIEFARSESARLQVPGTAVGVLHDGVIYAGGVGVTNVDNPLPVTARTLFQTGSTSKTVTATALMQLVEAGQVRSRCAGADVSAGVSSAVGGGRCAYDCARSRHAPYRIRWGLFPRHGPRRRCDGPNRREDGEFAAAGAGGYDVFVQQRRVLCACAHRRNRARRAVRRRRSRARSSRRSTCTNRSIFPRNA